MRLIASFLIIFITTELTVAQSNTSSIFHFLADVNMECASGAYEFNYIGTLGAEIRFVSYGEFDQLNSWDLRTFGETEKPKILENLN